MNPAPSTQPPRPVGRRRLLQIGLAGAAGLTAGLAASCGQVGRRVAAPSTPEADATTSTPAASSSAKVLVAYFSRPGENYYDGDRTWLEIGNTEVVARMIPDLINCDVYEIEPAEPYPDDYDQTVARNVREQDDDTRPAIVNPLADIEQYDVVLLGSPIWNVRTPMIMSTFTEAEDFTGKTVHPFTTHAMSGLGTSEDDYADTCRGAAIGEGLAIRGEEAQEARPALIDWLRRIGLNPSR